MDTTNILFICGGAFAGLEKVIQQRTNKSSIGFGANVSAPDERKTGDVLRDVEPEDLLKFGLIPEFVGRLPIMVTLSSLDEEALIKILTEPKNAIVKQFVKLFKMDGIDLSFTEDGISEIVAFTLERKTGARGLRSIVERTLQKAMYELPGSGIKKFVVDKELVKKALTQDNEKNVA